MRTKTRPHPAPTASRSSAASGDGLEALAAKLVSTQHELDALYAQLERLNRLASIGTIAGMIAHEFNNILTPIMSYSQMALAAPEDRELAQKALAKSLSGSERAARIADAILGFVRNDASAAGDVFHVEHAAPATADIAQVVRDALGCLASCSGQDRVGTTVRVVPGLTGAIAPVALQQVLVNLILNARNAMRSRGGTLEIVAAHMSEVPSTPRGGVDSRSTGTRDGNRSTWNTPGANRDTSRDSHSSGWVSIIVRDTGRGMAPEQLARMFTPFLTSTTTDRRGTGLGMVITKRLIERAGGWLVVESVIGRGTSMSIVLPAA